MKSPEEEENGLIESMRGLSSIDQLKRMLNDDGLRVMSRLFNIKCQRGSKGAMSVYRSLTVTGSLGMTIEREEMLSILRKNADEDEMIKIDNLIDALKMKLSNLTRNREVRERFESLRNGDDSLFMNGLDAARKLLEASALGEEGRLKVYEGVLNCDSFFPIDHLSTVMDEVLPP
jgi:hypothetical protein